MKSDEVNSTNEDDPVVSISDPLKKTISCELPDSSNAVPQSGSDVPASTENNDNANDTNAYRDEDEKDSMKVKESETSNAMLPRSISLGSMFDCGGGELMGLQKMFGPKQLLEDVDSSTKNIVDVDGDGDEEETMKFSDLSDNSRNIWVVTTAALPWRTGTAINPFLRCLYLVQRRLHLYRAKSSNEATNVNGIESNEEQSCGEDSSSFKPGKITLVIPWLDNPEDAAKLYGGHIVNVGEEGKQEQINWIRNYASEKCGMKGMTLLLVCFVNF